MPREVEKANEARMFGVFPREWGFPQGTQFSEERARWVRERVTEHRSLVAVRRRARQVAVASTAAGVAGVRRQRELLLRRPSP